MLTNNRQTIRQTLEQSLQHAVDRKLIPKFASHSQHALNLLHRIVPKPLQDHFVLYQVNTLAKEFIEQGELDFLTGKIVKFEITDLNACWFFTFDGQALKMLTHAGDHQVCFSANINALVLMASQKVDPDTLFFKRELQITGDTELGLEIKNLIDLFDISQLNGIVRYGLDKWSEALLAEVRHGQATA